MHEHAVHVAGQRALDRLVRLSAASASPSGIGSFFTCSPASMAS